MWFGRHVTSCIESRARANGIEPIGKITATLCKEAAAARRFEGHYLSSGDRREDGRVGVSPKLSSSPTSIPRLISFQREKVKRRVMGVGGFESSLLVTPNNHQGIKGAVP